jgi:3-oxoacyl-[acyl-carrier protein] reductase
VNLAAAPPDGWLEQHVIGVDALFELASAAHTALVGSSGSLLVTTSPAGIEGSLRLPFYAMAKGAQRAFVKALALEWGPDGVRVNALAPLAMSTAMHAAFESNPALERELAGQVALGRIGDAEADIGPVAVFLCSEAARYVTGQTIVVSGGRFTAL